MKFPEWYLHCVRPANCVAFLQVAQLCFPHNITSAPLSFHLHPSVQEFLWLLLSQPTVLLHLLPTGLLRTALSSISMFPWIHSITPTPGGISEVLFVTLRYNLKVTMLLMFCAWYRDICCVCLFPDVLSNCFLTKLPSISLLLKFFPAFLNVIHGNPFPLCLGVFFSFPSVFHLQPFWPEELLPD